MDAKQFGERLRELREAAGLSQAELAKAASLKQRAISYWERGGRMPAFDSVLALAEALGVDCTAFQQPPATGSDQLPDSPKRPSGRSKKKGD